MTSKNTLDKAAEAQLVSRAKAGHADAVRTLIDSHKDRLFAFIWRMVRNHHDAEEICQDAFLKAMGSLQTFSTEYRFSTWLFTIGYRICLNRMRRRKLFAGDVDVTNMTELATGDEDTLQSEETTRFRTCVWDAVDKLSPPQRATVLLFYRHDLGCNEIARILEIPVATVKSHLHRARQRLREILSVMSDQDLEHFRNMSGTAG